METDKARIDLQTLKSLAKPAWEKVSAMRR
jgi:hypothetical protein